MDGVLGVKTCWLDKPAGCVRALGSPWLGRAPRFGCLWQLSLHRQTCFWQTQLVFAPAGRPCLLLLIPALCTAHPT